MANATENPIWPAPGTTYGPDAASLDALRAWPGRGRWWTPGMGRRVVGEVVDV